MDCPKARRGNDIEASKQIVMNCVFKPLVAHYIFQLFKKDLPNVVMTKFLG